jgi:PAS domain S-box-containing protein
VGAQCLLGVLALAVLTLVCLRLQVNFSATVCLYLILVVLVSLGGSLLSSVVVSLLATGCLDYYFVPPLYSFEINDPRNQLAVVAFLTAATVISGLASRLHKARQDSYADMASRSHVEEALRHSEQQWRDVLENNPIMYFMVDARGTIMAVNPFRAEQLGHKVDELVGQPVLKLFFDADREAAQSRVAQCLQRLGQSMNWELRKRACVRHKPTSHVSAG